jgi:hypothetical protein
MTPFWSWCETNSSLRTKSSVNLHMDQRMWHRSIIQTSHAFSGCFCVEITSFLFSLLIPIRRLRSNFVFVTVGGATAPELGASCQNFANYLAYQFLLLYMHISLCLHFTENTSTLWPRGSHLKVCVHQVVKCLIKHHAMKTYCGVKVQLHAFLTSALDGGE